jgi:DNA polymerase-3 subunit delta
MVAVKTYQADAFLKAIARIPPAILFYGGDAGLIAERAQTLAKRLAEDQTPPGEIIRFDDADLEEDAGRIGVELQTVPMFGGRKIVRALAGRRVTAAALKPLIEGGGLEGYLIVEAGNLRPDDALRSLFEKAPGAAAVACFPDAARDLEGIVTETLATEKLRITADAKLLLLSKLGADRALSRAEIEKLALFALGKGSIEESDVEAAVGDAAELALDRIVMAIASGRLSSALVECDRCIAAGESPQTVVAALQRHFLRLHRMRSAYDKGGSLDDIVRQLRPPPHFKHRQELEEQCRAWSVPRLNAALARIAEAAKQARLSSALEGTLAENLLLELGALVRTKGP